MLVALLLAAQAAPAPASPNEADLRCLAIVAMAVSAAPPERRGGLAASAMYFVGRIDARTPGFDYRGEMTRLVRSHADFAADRGRCETLLKSRNAALSELGKGMAPGVK